ncbi:MAG: ParB/RepB/Spo0J family partition protein [Gammaproteobacteria bacterium]|nr:ParB/RepB/Spo0J family partition protein [Gammaproteobacteria bacterium]MDH3536756.1 ParB/RepB/Spo0J family partition protein [Gammaproteobacteria bacterium]
MKKKRLGRGLGSLIGNLDETTRVDESNKADGLVELDIDRIQRGKFQPRTVFDQESLQELADSIGVQGIVQPVIVRPEGNHYELVAGERRWRAAQLAGLQKIPAVIRELDARSAAAIALIENIQREDLNPLDEAQAFLRLIEEFDLTHQQVADSIGRSRASVSNLLRLLDLADPVKQQVNSGLLNMGHARALLALIRHDQVEVAKLVVNRGLSVRETELLVKKTLAAESGGSKKKAVAVDPDVRRLETRLSEKLGASVKIKTGKKGSGQLVIHFHSSAELDGILEHLSQ